MLKNCMKEKHNFRRNLDLDFSCHFNFLDGMSAKRDINKI